MGRSFPGARVRRWLAIGAVAVSALCGPRASAFELDGHFVIEAVAYKRLLGLAKVPGTEVSGRELLAALIAGGVLAEPRCFDHERPRDSGWSHEDAPPGAHAGPNAVTSWNPPGPDEVSGYRRDATSWLFFFAATAASTSQNQWVAGGVELRRDRDRWDRRSGWAPALSLAVASGTTHGSRGGSVSVAPILRFYLVPNRIWLGATPATFRVGALDGRSIGADVAGAAGLGIIIGKLELSAESPPLSYVSRERWHAIPVPVRLGLLWD